MDNVSPRGASTPPVSSSPRLGSAPKNDRGWVFVYVRLFWGLRVWCLFSVFVCSLHITEVTIVDSIAVIIGGQTVPTDME